METKELLRQAYEAYKKGEKTNVRQILEGILNNEPNNEEALFLMAFVVPTPEDAKTYLEKLLQINPNHAEAKTYLEKLNNKKIGKNKKSFKKPIKQSFREVYNKIIASEVFHKIISSPNLLRQIYDKMTLKELLGGILTLLIVVNIILIGIWAKKDNTIPYDYRYQEYEVECSRHGYLNYSEDCRIWNREKKIAEVSNIADIYWYFHNNGWEIILLQPTDATYTYHYLIVVRRIGIDLKFWNYLR
ncbi:MAG: hypothetical protein WCK35_16665 [Chloroflexota bacterium]